MLKSNIRVCDVCGEEIPADIKYRKVVLKSEIANLFFSQNPELSSTWTNLPDGNIQMDICLDCHMSMGDAVKDKIEQ